MAKCKALTGSVVKGLSLIDVYYKRFVRAVCRQLLDKSFETVHIVQWSTV